MWTGFGPWLAAAIVLGLGTAMVYPTLIAVVADVAEPRGGARSPGSTASGATSDLRSARSSSGLVADRVDARAAILVVAVLTAASGAVVALRMRETRPAS